MDDVPTHDWSLAELAQAETEPRSSRTRRMAEVWAYAKQQGLSRPLTRRAMSLTKTLTVAQVKERIDKHLAGVPLDEAEINEWEEG